MRSKAQWQACQTDACIISRNDRALIEVSGPDRAAFLQGLFSQDVVKNFPVGAVTYGVFPNVKGKTISDAFIVHLDENRFMLDVPKSTAEIISKHLDQYLILLKAEIKRVERYVRYSLLGPNTPSALIGDTPGTPLGQSRDCPRGVPNSSLDGFSVLIERKGLREFIVWTSAAQESKFLKMLEGAVAASESIYEMIQIEHGIAQWGREMDENTLPQEVGLEAFLNFQKGCFIGAEVLQRIHYQGHVNRGLVLVSSPSLIPRGTSVLQQGTEVGKITASIESFKWNQPIALALIKLSALENALPLSGQNAKLKILEGPQKMIAKQSP